MNRCTKKDKQTSICPAPGRELAAHPLYTHTRGRGVSVYQCVVAKGHLTWPSPGIQGKQPRTSSTAAPLTPSLTQGHPEKLYHSFCKAVWACSAHPQVRVLTTEYVPCLLSQGSGKSTAFQEKKKKTTFQCLPQPLLCFPHEALCGAGSAHGFPSQSSKPLPLLPKEYWIILCKIELFSPETLNALFCSWKNHSWV